MNGWSVRRQRKHWAELLDDQELIAQAVTVSFEGYTKLAIPVGGRRRFGSMPVPTPRAGRQVIEQLKPYPLLFPNLRYVRAGREYSANVEWGEPLPADPNWKDPIAPYYYLHQILEMSGHSDAAIERECGRMLAPV